MPTFTILHVCVGNICRSPMAERLLVLALRRRVGDRAERLYLSHGAGTGSWHIGEGMNPPAARQVVARGGDASGFCARRVTAELIDMSQLVLCATRSQVAAVLQLCPDAQDRTFVLGEFGRLLRRLDAAQLAALPVLEESDESGVSAFARGVALVDTVDAARRAERAGSRSRVPSRPDDDLDDPWGEPDAEYKRAADAIDRTVVPLAAALTGLPPSFSAI